MPFDWLLDKVTGSDPSVTDYVLAEAAMCPRCNGPVAEKILVDLRDDPRDEGADSRRHSAGDSRSHRYRIDA
jgi:hypothetical protein